MATTLAAGVASGCERTGDDPALDVDAAQGHGGGGHADEARNGVQYSYWLGGGDKVPAASRHQGWRSRYLGPSNCHVHGAMLSVATPDGRTRRRLPHQCVPGTGERRQRCREYSRQCPTIAVVALSS